MKYILYNYFGYKQTFAIIIGIVFSFIARIISKAIHKEQDPDQQILEISFVISYHITAFFQFIISEFIPIALWTAFKTPDDFFNVYNDLRKDYYQINHNQRFRSFLYSNPRLTTLKITDCQAKVLLKKMKIDIEILKSQENQKLRNFCSAKLMIVAQYDESKITLID